MTDTELDELWQSVKPHVQKMGDFSQLQIHLKRHAGKFSNTDLVNITPRRYTDNDPNVTLTTDIFNMIKLVAQAQLDGQLTFSTTFKKGKADLMTVQDFKKL